MATAAEIGHPETNVFKTEDMEPSVNEDSVDCIDIEEAKPKVAPLDINATGAGMVPRTAVNTSIRDKERKIGHRRVDNAGVVTYKKKPTSELMTAIQLGIGQSVGGLSSKPERDVLMQDFVVVESVFYPSEGSNLTPAHHCSDFRFKTYAPVAFRYFRELFDIQPDDFMLSLCDEPLQELSNPGASGSIFYITHDDEFIIKTVQHKEAEFLQKLLPGYFLNISQNPRTLLPKFYGLYCYQCGGKNIRFTVMNNLLPSSIKMHEKYDLKGSTYKRKASKHERLKARPTYKDLDFLEFHQEGVLLEKETYDALLKTLQRDCRVLESFKIMDYSLLIGIHNLDQSRKDQGLPTTRSRSESSSYQPPDTPQLQTDMSSVGTGPPSGKSTSLQRGKSFKTRVANYSTALEAIQADTETEEIEDEDVPPGGIPARNAKGERLYIYLGIIDILQSYRLKKKLEHTMKAIVIDGDTISVHRPGYYASRYLNFAATRVFKKIPTPLKHSPSKKKGQAGRPRAQTTIPEQPEPGTTYDRKIPERTQRTISFSDEHPLPSTIGGKPDLLPETSTPPARYFERGMPSPSNQNSSNFSRAVEVRTHSASHSDGSGDKRSEMMTQATYQSDEALTSRYISTIRSSPPLSLSESTPTHTEHTEGTPSFTTSSPSCSSDVLDSNTNNDRDFGPSPVSLSPDQVSPSKKTNSSTDASYSSALETTDGAGLLVEPQNLIAEREEVVCEPPPERHSQVPSSESVLHVLANSNMHDGHLHDKPTVPGGGVTGPAEGKQTLLPNMSDRRTSSTQSSQASGSKPRVGDDSDIKAMSSQNVSKGVPNSPFLQQVKQPDKMKRGKYSTKILVTSNQKARLPRPASEPNVGLWKKQSFGRVSLPGSKGLFGNVIKTEVKMNGSDEDSVGDSREMTHL